ncbi:MAG: NifB/NifX family molybdenum-iron cluster-binding protein [Candidatus Micrarchaeota archaeon]
MKIVVSCQGGGADGRVSEHFGRCPEFVVVVIEGKNVRKLEAVKNPYYENHVPGAVPKFISSLNADVLITGGIGPHALELFEEFGVKVVTGASGKIKEAVESFLRGELPSLENQCEH